MSNYYISNCCEAQVSEITSLKKGAETGICSECKEYCELVIVLDN